MKTRPEIIEDFKKVILENRSLAENDPMNLIQFKEGTRYLNTVPNIEAFKLFVNMILDLNE